MVENRCWKLSFNAVQLRADCGPVWRYRGGTAILEFVVADLVQRYRMRPPLSMKRTPLQLSAWWPRSRRTGILLPRMDLILQASGFSMSQNPAQDRKSDKLLYGWSRFAFGICIFWTCNPG